MKKIVMNTAMYDRKRMHREYVRNDFVIVPLERITYMVKYDTLEDMIKKELEKRVFYELTGKNISSNVICHSILNHENASTPREMLQVKQMPCHPSEHPTSLNQTINEA
jgi:hypothetical protein